jgi:hypothetical protein
MSFIGLSQNRWSSNNQRYATLVKRRFPVPSMLPAFIANCRLSRFIEAGSDINKGIDNPCRRAQYSYDHQLNRQSKTEMMEPP